MESSEARNFSIQKKYNNKTKKVMTEMVDGKYEG